MKYLILCSLFLFTLTSLGQEPEELTILEADPTWRKEIITFPISWAPHMVLQGFEELRFAPEWEDKDSPQFWSLVLAWDVKVAKELTINTIETNLEHYFDGLMKPNDSTVIIPKTNIVFIKKEFKDNRNQLLGKIKVYDNFHTKQMITINVLVHQYYCKKHHQSKVIFRFSLQDFNHSIWSSLKKIRLKANSCEL